MKTGYLITARLKSTRLPRKLLREVQGKPILCHMLDRLKLARSVEQIVICTSPLEEDRPLVELARQNGVSSFRGEPEDVLLRLLGAAREFGFDYVLNITADCPLVDPVYADNIVEAYHRTGADLIRTFDLPHGAFSYGIRPEALQKITEIKDSEHTEVWGRYFTDTDLFDVYDLPIENPLHRQPGLRMTLDYPEDLRFFEAIFDELYREGEVFSLDDVLELLERRPDIVDMNRHCTKPFTRRLNAQSEISLKARHKVQRAAIVGCGSIGQRHVRNLRQLGITELVALRSRKGHFSDLPAELNIKETTDPQAVVDAHPDVAIISNPTSLHLKAAERLLPHVRGLFLEKPIAASLDGIDAFLNRVRELKKVTFVGHNLQFHPAVLAIQDLLAEGSLGDPLVLQCQVGQWLPDWHPYEDFRKAYYARKDLGGGVGLSLIHEVHLAQELLGPIDSVCGLFPPHESLPLEVDVVADLMTRHRGGAVSQIHLDFIQRPVHRCGVLSCDHGWVRYDLIRPLVEAQIADEPEPRVIWDGADADPNQQYVDEMATFLRYVREGRVRHTHDAFRATQSLAALITAQQLPTCGCGAKVPDWVLGLG